MKRTYNELLTELKEEMTETAQTAAAEMAEKLRMYKETDIPSLFSNQRILIASPKGIQMGFVTVREGDMGTYRYVEYSLNNEALLYSLRYAATEQGWVDEPITTIHIDKESTVYAGSGL